MIRSELRDFCRSQIPGAKVQVVPDSDMNILLNKAADEIAAITSCLKADKKFDVVADQKYYNLSEVIGDYAVPDESGLWWNNGTEFKQVRAKTRVWLDKNRPFWRDEDSADPLYYSIDGDILTISPPGSEALTEGFRLYYGRVATPMTDDDHHPFSGSATELTHLRVFDVAIMKYVKWMVAPTLNKEFDADKAYQEFVNEVNSKNLIVQSRRDLTAESGARIKIPNVC